LNALKVVEVTAEALRASGLNKILNELKKCSNASVAACAKDVIETYKILLRASGVAPTPTPVISSSVTTPSVSSPKPSPTSESSSSSGSLKRKADESIEKTDIKRPVASTPKASTYTMASTGDSFRDKAQKFLYDALGSDDNDATEFRTQLAMRIEQGLYNHYGSSMSAEYKSRLRVILTNLKDPKNPDFNQRLYFCEVEPEELATMNEFDMASDALKRQRESDLKYAMEARKTDLNVGSVGTDMFQCPKCKERKTSYTQRQTRSADEPMTIFLTCLCCRHRWRQY